jgi:hypothetical protein
MLTLGMSVALGGPATSTPSAKAPMIRARLFRSLPAIVSAFVLASCADSGVSGPIAPPNAVEHRSSGHGFIPPALSGSPLNVDGLELRAAWWDKNLKSQVRVSRKIDATGGTISIPETGFTMYFPAGAVSAPITITVTADEKYVAYKMEPAGTKFLKEVIITQSLATTEFAGRLLKSPLFAAYIADDRVKLSGWVPVLELEPSETIFSVLSPRIPVAHRWFIKHFSRYMLASG